MALPARAQPGFDVDAFKASLRPGVAYREGYTSDIYVTEAQYGPLHNIPSGRIEYDVQVRMQYNGTEIPVGIIIVTTTLLADRISIDRFDNHFRTQPWLARLHDECFPHVVTSGILTSALYWLIKSLVPATADARRINLTLQAANLIEDSDEAAQEARQARLEAHYALLGFTFKEAFLWNMSTTVAHFLRTTRDFATITFIFAPNAVHPMSTRRRLM